MIYAKHLPMTQHFMINKSQIRPFRAHNFAKYFIKNTKTNYENHIFALLRTPLVIASNFG